MSELKTCTPLCIYLGLRAVLGEMSILVAVSTVDVLGGVVSV